MTKESYLAIGLMSGTSLDGVDASLLKTDGKNLLEPLVFYQLEYPLDFKQQLMDLARGDIPLSDVLRLERALTEYHAQAVKSLLLAAQLSAEDIDVIGFHGQTIRHLPDEGLTWQMGDASYLAERTGIRVVADFRRRDMAVGGQGAPFAPLYHEALLQKIERPAAVLNLGGVANITYFGEDGRVFAGDVGPGCSLLDQWAAEKLGKPYDAGGENALKGKVDEVWVQKAFKSLPFFAKPLPKSADRYEFDTCLPPETMTTEDGFASLCALTAQCVHQSMQQIAPSTVPLWLTGGGAHNKGLQKALGAFFPAIMQFDDLCSTADRLEADCFAWLAVRRLLGLETSRPETTGAKKPTTGGVLTGSCIY